MDRKTTTVLAIAATAVASGVLMAFTGRNRGLAALAQLPSIAAWVLLYVWYKLDVAQHRLRTSTEFNGLVIALSWLALPIYLVRSRGLLLGVATATVFYLGMLGWTLLATATLALVLVAQGH